MDYIIDVSIATFIVCLGVALTVIAKVSSNFLREKANESYDVSRSRKVSAILDMVEINIATGITNYLAAKGYAKINEVDLREAAAEISVIVTNITGGGIVEFVIDTFTDDWDEWLVEKIQESMLRRAQFEKK